MISLRDFLVSVKRNTCMMNACCLSVYGTSLGVVNLFSFDEKCKCMLYLKTGTYIYNLLCKYSVHTFLMLQVLYRSILQFLLFNDECVY